MRRKLAKLTGLIDNLKLRLFTLGARKGQKSEKAPPHPSTMYYWEEKKRDVMVMEEEEDDADLERERERERGREREREQIKFRTGSSSVH